MIFHCWLDQHIVYSLFIWIEWELGIPNVAQILVVIIFVYSFVIINLLKFIYNLLYTYIKQAMYEIWNRIKWSSCVVFFNFMASSHWFRSSFLFPLLLLRILRRKTGDSDGAELNIPLFTQFIMIASFPRILNAKNAYINSKNSQWSGNCINFTSPK